MRKVLFVACIIFLFLPLAHAAGNGTVAAETWYARPVGVCPLKGNGSSYTCATSDGGDGAFSGLLNLDWTPVNGIDDGDTLRLCGRFSVADRRNNTTVLEVAASGSSGAPITIDGDCSMHGAPTKATVDAANVVKVAVLTNDNSHLRIRNIVGINGSLSAPAANFRSAQGTDVHFINNESSGGAVGLLIGGTAFVIDGFVVRTNTILTDVINVGVGATSGTIRNSDLLSGNWPNADVIEIQGDEIVSMLIENNTLNKGDNDKSTLTIKHGTGTYVIRGNEFNGRGTQAYGLRMPGTFSGTIQLVGNLFRGYGAISSNEVQLDNSIQGARATITSNMFEGGAYQVVAGDLWTLTVNNNTFSNAATSAIYSAGTAGIGLTSVSIRNNIFYGATRYIKSFGYENALTLDYNSYFGGGDFQVDNTIHTALSDLRAATTYEPHGISTDRTGGAQLGCDAP